MLQLTVSKAIGSSVPGLVSLIQSSILAESRWWTKWLTSCYTESRKKRLETGYTPPQCNGVASWGQASNIPGGNDFTS